MQITTLIIPPLHEMVLEGSPCQRRDTLTWMPSIPTRIRGIGRRERRRRWWSNSIRYLPLTSKPTSTGDRNNICKRSSGIDKGSTKSYNIDNSSNSCKSWRLNFEVNMNGSSYSAGAGQKPNNDTHN
jgi:hypothetical protein